MDNLYLIIGLAFMFAFIAIIFVYRKFYTPSGTPILDQYSRDLTTLAKENKLDPVIGRDKEIERVIQILSRRTKNNVILIGAPGVGKTAIVEGLADRICRAGVPEALKDKRVLALDLGGLVADTRYRGEFEKRVRGIMDEIGREERKIILFIDEVHTLSGAGGAEGAIDADDILKPPLARGELQAIGATTPDEYENKIRKDMTLERRFQPLIVKEPTPEETISILKGLKKIYEDHHKVIISDDALKTAVDLASNKIKNRFLPDKAIDLIDEACAMVKLSDQNTTSKIRLKVESKHIRKVLKSWINEPIP